MQPIQTYNAARSAGRPHSHDQDKLHFFVFIARARASIEQDSGKTPTDTEIFKLIVSRGGYQYLVAGNWNEIQIAQKTPNGSKRVKSFRLGPFGVRSKAVSGMKALRNFYARAKNLAATDPTFLPFAERLLQQYGIGEAPSQEITLGYCAGWRPPLKCQFPN